MRCVSMCNLTFVRFVSDRFRLKVN
uniref:Uncharacterized protein n=1 Tax=Anguilla anguilla TaxID=7936 RepID=A0A0E9QPZ7_ANGAN